MRVKASIPSVFLTVLLGACVAGGGCPTGFEEVLGRCMDVDECASDPAPCDEKASCTNEEGGFECRCNPGYVGDGATCEDQDECAINLDDCGENAVCTNTLGAFECECDLLHEGDGKTCVDRDECEDYGATVEFRAASSTDRDRIDRLTRFSIDHSLNFVNLEAPDGESDSCGGLSVGRALWAPGRCEDLGTYADFLLFFEAFGCTTENIEGTPVCLQTLPGNFYDVTFTDFTPGESIAYSRTLYRGGPCGHPDATCENLAAPEGFSCTNCQEGTVFDAGRCRIAPACETANPCEQASSCQDTTAGPRCRCNRGFEANESQTGCDDIDECAEELDDCSPAETCVNEPGSFRCDPA